LLKTHIWPTVFSCLRRQRFLLLLFVALIWQSAAYAQFTVIDGKTKILSESLSISARCNLDLTPEVEEALNNGIELHLIFQFRLYMVRPFIWDNRLADWEQGYILKYHSLYDQYLLIDDSTNEQESFISVREAMESLSDFKTTLPAITATLPKSESGYRMGMRVRLNKNKFPSPLKLLGEISPSWDLDSSWKLWPVVD